MLRPRGGPPLSSPAVERYGNVLRFPASGRLIVATDLHGHQEDMKRVASAFERRLAEAGDAYLLFTGDIIHGPAYSRADWPPILGEYYPDESPRLVELLLELQKKHPKRVFALIGNHEHSHVGGPPTRKFHRDPSETEFFERTIGEKKAAEYKRLFRSLPLAALAGKGIVVTHGAPRVLAATFADVCSARYEGHETKSVKEMLEVPVLGELLWTRAAGPIVVRRFLRRMELPPHRNRIVVYGHDPVREGFQSEGREQLCFSTSFGCRNVKKVYLDLDLSREYESVLDLGVGVEIKRLYPELSSAGSSESRERSVSAPPV